MKVDLTNKKAIVTGGANGIGLACAQTLAGAGAEVWVFDLERENPQAVAAGFGANGHPADVSNRESLELAFAAAGAPDIVIANAGTAVFAGLAETSASDWQRVIDVNLSGVFHTVQIAAALMKPGGGSVVITASTNSFDGEPQLLAYNASKAGVLGLMRTAAGELGPHRIRVNAVCPGLIRTRLTDDAFTSPDSLKEYFRQIPLGCGGTPAEVANAAVFLASDLASYITGATLIVDGGQTATKFGTWNEDTATFTADHWTLKPD